MNNKDFLTLSLTIFRHTVGISLWIKSDPTTIEEKVSDWKKEKKKGEEKTTVVKGGYIQVPTNPAPRKMKSGTWGTAMPKADDAQSEKDETKIDWNVTKKSHDDGFPKA